MDVNVDVGLRARALLVGFLRILLWESILFGSYHWGLKLGFAWGNGDAHGGSWSLQRARGMRCRLGDRPHGFLPLPARLVVSDLVGENARVLGKQGRRRGLSAPQAGM